LLSIRASPGALDRVCHGIIGFVEPSQPGKRESNRAGELRVRHPPAGLAADFERFAQDRQALGERAALDEQLAAQELSGRHPKRRIHPRRQVDEVGDRIFCLAKIPRHWRDPANAEIEDPAYRQLVL
jgi:hypothetical protein